MACSIRALNADASFEIFFMPAPSAPFGAVNSTKPFTIIADPWLVGSSNIGHRIISSSVHLTPPFITSLAAVELDVIIISQEKSDHCHEETLKTLPPSGGHFIIIAEPAAAKKIRGWKYFADEKVITLPKWEDGVHEIVIPGPSPSSTPGKIIIGFISPKWSLKAPAGLHKTIAISYQPPSALTAVDTPPQTPPEAAMSASSSRPNFLHPSAALSPSASSPSFIYPSQLIGPRPVSIIFAPHGCDSAAVEKYAYAHFSPIGALPPSALLHCFDEITNPTYLGGNICKGLPGGLKLAQSLHPEVWISTHDGDKEVKGLTTGALTITKYNRDAVEQAVSPRVDSFADNIWERPPPTVIKLCVGEVHMLPKGVENLYENDDEPLTPGMKNQDAKKRQGVVFAEEFASILKI